MSTEWIFLYNMTMMARPTVTSAAATTMMKKTKSCASVPAVVALSVAKAATWCILEKSHQQHIHRIQHQFNAHENDDSIPPGQHTNDSDGEQGKRKKNVIIYWYNRHNVGILLGNNC